MWNTDFAGNLVLLASSSARRSDYLGIAVLAPGVPIPGHDEGVPTAKAGRSLLRGRRRAKVHAVARVGGRVISSRRVTLRR